MEYHDLPNLNNKKMRWVEITRWGINTPSGFWEHCYCKEHFDISGVYNIEHVPVPYIQ